jgi:hypothetical protein
MTLETSALELVAAPMTEAEELNAAAESDRMACPGCGKLLRVRTLAEKHTCARKPRKSWKTDPERLRVRRRAAAERRFLARRGGEVVEIRGGSR